MEGEHFVIADLRRLISSSACPSGGPIVEASSRVQGVGSASNSLTPPSEDSSSAHPVPNRRTKSSRPERIPLHERVAESAPRVIKIKRKGAAGRRDTPGSNGEDFVPRVSIKHEDFQDLEDEEREERMTGLLDRYVARKRNGSRVPAVSMTLPPPRLWDVVSPLLRGDRWCRPLSSSALPNRGL